MRRDIVSLGAFQLNYEIRGIVEFASKIQESGQKIIWENVGDPVAKGENIPDWMKNVVFDVMKNDLNWAYCPTIGVNSTRKFLADLQNKNKNNAKIDENDIIFFNGLGDAISKIYSLLKTQARVLGPSPAYPTHSSAEGAHSGYEHLTYKLDPKNNWIPDIDDIRNKVKYNDSIVAILIINPDNPTGMVYPRWILEKIVEIAKEYDLFLISDEIYSSLTYNGVEMVSLSEVAKDLVPNIIMKGISKELPWPGARCGWIEVHNRNLDKNFDLFVKSIINSKMLEVCSTTLPQAVIPQIMSDKRYYEYISDRCLEIEKRANFVYELFKDVKGVIVNRTYGAFYTSIVFEDGVLNNKMFLKIDNLVTKELVEKAVCNVSLDKRFVYYLLGSCGICVVPLSSFCCDLQGFRITFLEKDFDKFKNIYLTLKEKINEYLSSSIFY